MQTAQAGPGQRDGRGAGYGPGLLACRGPGAAPWSSVGGVRRQARNSQGPGSQAVVIGRWFVVGGWPAARLPVGLSCRRSARGRSPFRGSLVVVAWSFPPPGPGLVALLPGGSAGGVSSLVHALAFSVAWLACSGFGFCLRSGFVARCPARPSAPWVRCRPPSSVSAGGRRGAGPEGWVTA